MNENLGARTACPHCALCTQAVRAPIYEGVNDV